MALVILDHNADLRPGLSAPVHALQNTATHTQPHCLVGERGATLVSSRLLLLYVPYFSLLFSSFSFFFFSSFLMLFVVLWFVVVVVVVAVVVLSLRFVVGVV